MSKTYNVEFKMTHEFFELFQSSVTPFIDIKKYMLKDINIQDYVECRIINGIWRCKFNYPIYAIAFKLRGM